MGVYIKGIEMPKSGVVIAIISSNGTVKLSEELINFPACGTVNMVKQVEAIELPPHGRPIDADELSYCETRSGDVVLFPENISEAPTVIEAEGE